MPRFCDAVLTAMRARSMIRNRVPGEALGQPLGGIGKSYFPDHERVVADDFFPSSADDEPATRGDRRVSATLSAARRTVCPSTSTRRLASRITFDGDGTDQGHSARRGRACAAAWGDTSSTAS